VKQSLRLTSGTYLCNLQLPSFYKQANVVWVEFFPLKIPAHDFFPQKKKKKKMTKYIFAEKLNDYLGQYKFEAYSIFKDQLKCYACHLCHLFSPQKAM